MTLNEMNGGKGMTRVEIARRAYLAVDGKAQAARRRLDAAMAAEAEGAVKKSGSKAKAISTSPSTTPISIPAATPSRCT